MRGEIQLVSGERRDKGRSEAEYRAERAKVRCAAGERFEVFERREFTRNRNAFDDAIRAAVVAMEDANFTTGDIKAFKDQVDDFCGDTWNVDPRKED